jgi:hypothetical protein
MVNKFKRLPALVAFITIMFLLAVPVFAVGSNFLDEASKYYQKNCIGVPNKILNEKALNCYLFEKASELNLLVDNLNSRLNQNDSNDASQSAEIANLKTRLEILESLPLPTPLACIPAPSGLMSWWPGDNNADDIIGTNNGTAQNGASFALGKVGGAFSFDGEDDFIQTSTNNLPIGNNERTIEFWVKVISFLDDSPNPHSPLETFFTGYGNFGTSNSSYHTGTAGNIIFFSQWGTGFNGPSLITDTWYHVAITNIGNDSSLYLDGNLVGNGNVLINTPPNTNLYMGRIPGILGDIRRLNGLADEVSIYNRALTSNEILSIFNAGSAGKCK